MLCAFGLMKKTHEFRLPLEFFAFDDDVHMVGIAGGKQEVRNAHNFAGASMPLIK